MKIKIRELFVASKRRVGSPKIAKTLRKENWSVSVRRTKRLMREEGYQPTYPEAENLLNRQFTVSSTNVVWVTDITYLKGPIAGCILLYL